MLENAYLESYNDIGIHRLMLDDKPRTLAYRNAIFENRSRFKDKIVLDVGCGTGVLSIFCAQSGAKKVHAVESSSLAKSTEKVVEENNLSSVISVHHCRVEDLELDTKVDIIVSEWMGFYLVHEGMLQSVLFARDKFLQPNGLIFPESADLWVAACELPQYFEYWDDVYGVKMTSIGEAERNSKSEPVVTLVKPEHLLTEPSVLKTFSLNNVKEGELAKIRDKILLPCTKNGRYQGICLWFVVNFPSENSYLCFNTGPNEPPTHWQQTAIVFPHGFDVEVMQPIAFDIQLESRKDDSRKYNIEVTMLDPDKEEHPTPCDCYLTKCIVIKKYMEDTMNTDCNELEDDLIEEES